MDGKFRLFPPKSAFYPPNSALKLRVGFFKFRVVNGFGVPNSGFQGLAQGLGSPIQGFRV